MGLLLSVLVVCVGVVELLDFCYNIRRNLTLVPDSRNLPQVRDNYLKELEGQNTNTAVENVININPDNVPRIRLNRDCLSHEDVEIEVNKKVLQDRSRSSSPRRYLVTEKEKSARSRSPSPRQFVVSEEPQGLQRSQHQNSIPEFLFHEKELQDRSSPSRRIVLKGDETGIIPPLPLPKQFVVTEEVLSHIQANSTVKNKIEICENFYEAESSVSRNNEPGTSSSFNYLDYEQVRTFQSSSARTEQLLQAENEAPARSRSPSPIPRRFADAYRRSPSPFPSFDLLAPRNSICTELLDNPPVSVSEIDEEGYRSHSPTPDNVLVTPKNYNTTEYNSNKLLVTTPTRNRSPSPNTSAENTLCPLDPFRIRSKSESKKNDNNSTPNLRKTTSQYQLCEATEIVVEKTKEPTEQLDPQFLNNLDGVKNESKKSRKNKRRKSVHNSFDKPSTSNQSNESVNNDMNMKEPEAFWLIFSGEYTKAMNKDWHGQHFCCWQCDESLTGQRYVLRDEHPYCVACYESVFANACEKCSRTIGIDSKDLSYKDKHWHEACFLCTTCGESLVDKQFGSKGDRIYCGRCYDDQFASRCDGCHEIFRAGTKKMEYKTRQWHEKCFCCCVCKVPIGTQSFIPREQEIYCAGCYEEKFATRCIKCNKVITSGGVTYKNEPWHRECFTCTNCQKSLAGERFTSRDEKPYCAECFGELFAKRCFACNKPITGIGGTKFISFEDRHWHNDCFHCASCKTSLVGRGFITDQDDIICPDCAKQKLM